MSDTHYENLLVCMLQQQESMKREMDSLQKLNTQFMGRIEYLEEKIRQMESYYEYETEYSDDAYNYLAIGNSLTLITSWGRGICSTRRDNDYFNLVCRALRGGGEDRDVVAYPYNFAQWERYPQRNDANDLLLPFLSDKLNLLTIQLGENCGNDFDTLDTDLVGLVDFIRAHVESETEIIIVGDFWNQDRNEKRRMAAVKSGCRFADLSEIIGDKSYQTVEGMHCQGRKVGDDDIIVSKAASTHPGDKGMRYIADRIIEQLNFCNSKS